MAHPAPYVPPKKRFDKLSKSVYDSAALKNRSPDDW